MSGESEKKIRNLFKEAKDTAPSIIFIDEIDSICPRRDDAQKEMEVRMVAQLLSCMDDIANSVKQDAQKIVFVIGATNRPDTLEPALRRSGRFDHEITLGMPDAGAREKILQKLCFPLKLSEEIDFREISKLTPGYVGADLKSLTTIAAQMAVQRIFKDFRPAQEENPVPEEQLKLLTISMRDFQEALKKVQPSSTREGFVTVPSVTWDDIGALSEIREELQMSIIEPIMSPEIFLKLGFTTPSGVLLFGPPGVGKVRLH